MFLEFTPVTHSPADEAASFELATLPTRLARPLNALVLVALAAGGGYEATQYVCDKLTAGTTIAKAEPPLIRTVVREQTAPRANPGAPARVLQPSAAGEALRKPAVTHGVDAPQPKAELSSLAQAAAAHSSKSLRPELGPSRAPAKPLHNTPSPSLAAAAARIEPMRPASEPASAAPSRFAAARVEPVRPVSEPASAAPSRYAAAGVEPVHPASEPASAAPSRFAAGGVEAVRAASEPASAAPSRYAAAGVAPVRAAPKPLSAAPSSFLAARSAYATGPSAAAEQTRASNEPAQSPALQAELGSAAPLSTRAAQAATIVTSAQPGRAPGVHVGLIAVEAGELPHAALSGQGAGERPRETSPDGRLSLDVPPLTAAATHRGLDKPRAVSPKPVVQLLRVHGALTSRRAARAIARVEPLMAACWHDAAGPSAWKLTSSIDPHGRARTTHVAAISGSAHAATLQPCLERAAHQLQVDAPDTGGAVIEWSVTASR